MTHQLTWGIAPPTADISGTGSLETPLPRFPWQQDSVFLLSMKRTCQIRRPGGKQKPSLFLAEEAKAFSRQQPAARTLWCSLQASQWITHFGISGRWGCWWQDFMSSLPPCVPNVNKYSWWEIFFFFKILEYVVTIYYWVLFFFNYISTEAQLLGPVLQSTAEAWSYPRPPSSTLPQLECVSKVYVLGTQFVVCSRFCGTFKGLARCLRG